ncbi:MAG: hypothetical protein OEV92_10890 [Nitrospinota bacterium]|nr:hypothetical protein [Nitrospinota bacterium]
MNRFVKTERSMKGALAAVCMALALVLPVANCGQTSSHYPPAQAKVTKMETFVNNLSVPGAPRNTAYNGGEAEIVAYVQGTGTHVAFYIPMNIGFPWGVYSATSATTTDPVTGVTTTTYTYSTLCDDINYAVPCLARDGWAYSKIDSQGHARLMFLVGSFVGWYDVVTRPVVFNGNGAIDQKIEYENRTRVFFSNDIFAYYN